MSWGLIVLFFVRLKTWINDQSRGCLGLFISLLWFGTLNKQVLMFGYIKIKEILTYLTYKLMGTNLYKIVYEIMTYLN